MSNELNDEATAQGAEELKELNELFENYQKGGNGTNGAKKKTKEEILAKYFVPRKSKETFRPLPPKGREKIDVAFFHVAFTNKAGGKKQMRKLYCPAHNDPPVQKKDETGKPVFDQNGKPVMIPQACPLCAKYNAYIAKQNPALKGLKKDDYKNLTDEQKKVKEYNDKIFDEAKKWQAKKFYILRGIDKGAEKDGVKFWRFKHNFKKQGVFDKLIPALQNFIDQNSVAYYDAKQGCDLSITTTEAEFMGRKYIDVSAIFPGAKSELHKDNLIAESWLNDTTTWRDIFKPATAPVITPYEYLVLVGQGNDPYWEDSDANSKHWVFPNNPDLQAKANTRDQNLDAGVSSRFEYATDVVDEDDTVNITNINTSDKSSFTDSAVNVTAEVNKSANVEQPVVATTNTAPVVNTVTQQAPSVTQTTPSADAFNQSVDNGAFDDLPF
jgi:hypothetical protein